MGFLFNLILLLIFVYLIYRIAIQNRSPKDPYDKREDDTNQPDPDEDRSIRKKIDMSDVEDADYKEVK